MHKHTKETHGLPVWMLGKSKSGLPNSTAYLKSGFSTRMRRRVFKSWTLWHCNRSTVMDFSINLIISSDIPCDSSELRTLSRAMRPLSTLDFVRISLMVWYLTRPVIQELGWWNKPNNCWIKPRLFWADHGNKISVWFVSSVYLDIGVQMGYR